jgi:hypothetical protein
MQTILCALVPRDKVKIRNRKTMQVWNAEKNQITQNGHVRCSQ